VEAVGLGSAIISVALLLSFVASLGLGFGLIRFLPDLETSPSRLINSCFLLTSVTAIAVALFYLAGLSLFSPSMLFIKGSIFLSIAFVIFVLIRAIFNLLTPIYVARRRAEYSFIQAVVLGALRIAFAVSVVGWLGAFGIFAAWGLATTLICLAGILFFLPRLVAGYRIKLAVAPKPSDRYGLSRSPITSAWECGACQCGCCH
jgi:O-antigen/teichoic acid export membrane protein